jgi:hypothetical protein
MIYEHLRTHMSISAHKGASKNMITSMCITIGMEGEGEGPSEWKGKVKAHQNGRGG